MFIPLEVNSCPRMHFDNDSTDTLIRNDFAEKLRLKGRTQDVDLSSVCDKKSFVPQEVEFGVSSVDGTEHRICGAQGEVQHACAAGTPQHAERCLYTPRGDPIGGGEGRSGYDVDRC